MIFRELWNEQKNHKNYLPVSKWCTGKTLEKKSAGTFGRSPKMERPKMERNLTSKKLWRQIMTPNKNLKFIFAKKSKFFENNKILFSKRSKKTLCYWLCKIESFIFFKIVTCATIAAERCKVAQKIPHEFLPNGQIQTI